MVSFLSFPLLLICTLLFHQSAQIFINFVHLSVQSVIRFIDFQYCTFSLSSISFLYYFLLSKYFLFNFLSFSFHKMGGQAIDFIKNFFLCFFLAVLGVCCFARAWAFLQLWQVGATLQLRCMGLIVVVSLVVEHSLQARGLQQLQHTGSVVELCGL